MILLNNSVSLDWVPGVNKIITDSINNFFFPYGNDVSIIKNLIQNRSDFKYRQVLHDVLIKQYSNFSTSVIVQQNIASLLNKNTFTVCTGHQLVVAGGPLYVLSKISSIIALSKKLNNHFPNHHFVPVFWLASEDHDKEEISSFNLFKQEVKILFKQHGAVGEFSTQIISESLRFIIEKNQPFFELIELAYSQKTLSKAHAVLINELFKHEGLVVLDGNDKALKQLFIPVIKEELHHQITYKKVSETNRKLADIGCVPKVNPRPVNLFLLEPNSRKRLEHSANSIYTNENDFAIELSEIDNFVNENYHQFSPNVLMRPLYQETILPNIVYCGGPAEIEYWMQLDDLFKHFNCPMPLRQLRFMATVIQEKSIQRLDELKISTVDLFLNEDELKAKVARQNSASEFNISNEIENILIQFDNVCNKIEHIDSTLIASVNAEKARLMKAFDNIQQKVLRSQKAKAEVLINRAVKIRESILPDNIPQDRNVHMAEFSPQKIQELTNALIENGKFGEMQFFQE